MAHVAKYTRSAMGQLCQHYERKKDANGNYIKFGNQDIDLSRTDGNYNLAPHYEGGQINFIRNRLSEVKCLNRADVNVMCSWVVTLPQTFPASKEREFFSATYRFLAERYSEENVVSAYVHRDENQPHLHFAFIPVTVGKNGKEKVSAKEVLTKAELQKFHPELQKSLEQYFGFQVEILNGATENGNCTVAELKAAREKARAEKMYDSYSEDIDGMTFDILNTKEQVDSIHQELAALEEQKSVVQGEIDSLQTRLLTAQEVDALGGKKTLTGALKGVAHSDYEALKRTAAKVDIVERERNIAIARAETAEKRADFAEKEAEVALHESPSFQMQKEKANLAGRLGRMERRLRELLRLLPAQIQVFIQSILNDREPHYTRTGKERQNDKPMSSR